MLLHSTIFLMSTAPLSGGGLMHPGEDLERVLHHGSGVCTQIAAMVPTTTIMKAAADSSAVQASAFQHGAHQDRDERENQADDAQNVQKLSSFWESVPCLRRQQ